MSDESLATQAPFHLEATVRVLQRRPSHRVDLWQQERYLRVLRSEDELSLLEVRNEGTVDRPDVRFRVRAGGRSTSARIRFAQTLRRTLGLDVEVEPLALRARKERGLQPTARALRGMRPPRFADLFETFAQVIPFQQVSLDAGSAIVGRLVERFGDSLEHEGRRFHAFPAARVVAASALGALREVGLTARKAAALRELARLIDAGSLREEELSAMPSSAAQRLLVALPGIGPWSASLVLLRGLGRLDVYPPGDIGATRALRALLQLESDAALERVVERFGEYRGYLYLCALGGGLLEKKLIRPAFSSGASK